VKCEICDQEVRQLRRDEAHMEREAPSGEPRRQELEKPDMLEEPAMPAPVVRARTRTSFISSVFNVAGRREMPPSALLFSADRRGFGGRGSFRPRLVFRAAQARLLATN